MNLEKNESIYCAELLRLGLDEGLIKHACDENENNLSMQLEELYTTVNLLASSGLTEDEQKYFVSMASDVLYQYRGDQRRKERYNNEIMPTFIHLLKAIQVATNTYSILTKPEDFHTLGLPADFFEEHEEHISTYIETWEQNTLVIALGLLFHDSPEDFKFMVVGDIEDVKAYKRIESEVFVGKKKDLEIADPEDCAPKHIYPCDIDALLSDDSEKDLDYSNIGPLCVLSEWRSLYEYDEEKALQVLDNDKPTKQKRELFLGLSYYHILRRTKKKGNSLSLCLQSMEEVDKVTFRSIAKVSFTDKGDLLRGIYQSPIAAIMKGGDVGHNFSTLELLKLAKPDTKDKIAYKYNDYLDTFEAAASFWLEIYPIICDRMGMKLDPQMQEKIDAYKARKKQLDNQTRSSQPLYTHHNVDYTQYKELMQEIVEKAKGLLLDESGVDKEQVVDRLFDDIISLSTSLEIKEKLHSESQQDFTLLDTFNGAGVFNEQAEKEKKIPMQHMIALVTTYLSENEYTLSSKLPYGFEVNSSGIGKLNTLLNNALHQYRFELYGHIPSSFLNESYIKKGEIENSYEFTLQSTQDLLRFFQVSTKKKYGQRKQFACSLLKLGFQNMLLNEHEVFNEQDEGFADVLGHDFLSVLTLDIRKKTKIDVLNEKKKKGLYKIEGASWDQYYASIQEICTNGRMKISWEQNMLDKLDEEKKRYPKDMPDVAIENIYVTTKTGETARHKQLDIPEYGNFELAQESHGIRCEVKDVKDVLLTAQYMYYNFFDEDISGMKNIHMISSADLNNHKAFLTSEFYRKLQFLLMAFDHNDPNSHELYRELRLQGNVGSKQKVPTNLRIVMSDATDAYDLSHFAVHEGGNKIKSMIRLEGYVNDDYMHHVASMQVNNHPELMRIGAPPGFDNAVVKIINHRKEILLHRIRRTKNSSSKSQFYTTKKRWNGLKQQGFFADTEMFYDHARIDTSTPDVGVAMYHDRIDRLFRKVAMYSELHEISDAQRLIIDNMKTRIYAVISSLKKMSDASDSDDLALNGMIRENKRTLQQLRELLEIEADE